jgi:NitT/TauT family transport system substrate-binding protein
VNLKDLEGKKVGVAGGPVDKSWLLIQGLAAKRHGMDLAAAVEPAYGAPPLLNEKVQDGELDAVLNYWHFAARLEAKGFKPLVGVEEAIAELGVASVPPQIGYVFEERFGTEHPGLIEAFAAASREAKQLLMGDAEWQRIRPLTKAEDDATFEALKRRYRAGIIEHWSEAERADAAKLYAILAERGGEKLVGEATELAPGTFWPDVTY